MIISKFISNLVLKFIDRLYLFILQIKFYKQFKSFKNTKIYAETYEQLRKFINISDIEYFTINNDKTIDYYGNIYINNIITEIPIKFREINGNLSIVYCNMKSLKNMPDRINGKLSILESTIGDFSGCTKYVSESVLISKCKLDRIDNLFDFVGGTLTVYENIISEVTCPIPTNDSCILYNNNIKYIKNYNRSTKYLTNNPIMDLLLPTLACLIYNTTEVKNGKYLRIGILKYKLFGQIIELAYPNSIKPDESLSNILYRFDEFDIISKVDGKYVFDVLNYLRMLNFLDVYDIIIDNDNISLNDKIFLNLKDVEKLGYEVNR